MPFQVSSQGWNRWANYIQPILWGFLGKRLSILKGRGGFYPHSHMTKLTHNRQTNDVFSNLTTHLKSEDTLVFQTSLHDGTLLCSHHLLRIPWVARNEFYVVDGGVLLGTYVVVSIIVTIG